MRIDLDRDDEKALYLQIFEQIRGRILTGELQPGFRLPAERKLAESLGVNRTTVLNAYRELKADGLVGALVGMGTVVLPGSAEEPSAIYQREPAWNQLLSRYSERIESVLLSELLELASRKDVISFATGIASPESGPVQALSGLEREILGSGNYEPLLHSPTEGFLSMRRAVCGLMQKRGIYCSAGEVLMLSGSQQGIDLAARVFLDPGDIVVVEEPTYFPALQVFRAAGVRIISVPVDDKGMRVELLEQILHRYHPKLIYSVPTFQNPTGTVLALERRKTLVALASKYNVMVLEDDAYGDLWYEGEPLPSLKALDGGGNVIYLSTFSKNVYSGLRLGWMVGHRNVISKFASAKQLTDLHSSSLSQWIVQRFIENGSLESHLAAICVENAEKRDTMCQALRKYAPEGLHWVKPSGGYYIWCRLPEGISSAKLISKAAAHKVSFVPGSPFFLSGQGEAYIRLNFTFVSAELIEEGVRRLCGAMRALAGEIENRDGGQPVEINPIV